MTHEWHSSKIPEYNHEAPSRIEVGYEGAKAKNRGEATFHNTYPMFVGCILRLCH